MTEWVKELEVGSVVYREDTGIIAVKEDVNSWREVELSSGWNVSDDSVDMAYNRHTDLIRMADAAYAKVSAYPIGTVLYDDKGALFKLGKNLWTVTGSDATLDNMKVSKLKGLREVK